MRVHSTQPPRPTARATPASSHPPAGIRDAMAVAAIGALPFEVLPPASSPAPVYKQRFPHDPLPNLWVATAPGVHQIAPGSALRFRGVAHVYAWDTTLEILDSPYATELKIDAPTNFNLDTG